MPDCHRSAEKHGDDMNTLGLTNVRESWGHNDAVAQYDIPFDREVQDVDPMTGNVDIIDKAIRGLNQSKASRRDWVSVIRKLDFAFQPIVNIHNGICFGYEALVRNWKEAGFSDIRSIFDEAYDEGLLYHADVLLRCKAIRKFASIPGSKQLKLFYNLDNRCITMPGYQPGNTGLLMEANGMPPSVLYLEISEHHDVGNADLVMKNLQNYRAQGYKLALDDYGTGFSQLKTLYQCEPDIIKIDRFFISNIHSDKKKELLVSQVVGMAHLIGLMVVAEGVETEQEYFACKRIGCDLLQGFLVQRPTTDITEVRSQYGLVEKLAESDRRTEDNDATLIRSRMKEIEPVSIYTEVAALLSYFLENREATVLPVVDDHGHPVGIIRETDFKGFLYSPFGRELLNNSGAKSDLQRFIKRSSVANLSDTVERILEIFSMTSNEDGVLVVDNLCYVGFLDSRALLEMLNEKNTLAARDQNPLTQLPGNNAIFRYASQALMEEGGEHCLYYLDFDNFKPFNDAFGFRQGDRAINLFADILRKSMSTENWFIGHIGGDDFFLGSKNLTWEDSKSRVREVLDAFRQGITPFYDSESRSAGFMQGVSRDGESRRIPLMTVSAAMLQLPKRASLFSFDDVSSLIGVLKKNAKESGDHFCAAGLSLAPMVTPEASTRGFTDGSGQA